MENIEYNKNQEPIVLSKYTLDRLLKEKNFAELLALYTFYYYTAKWQGTNKAKSTTGYTAKGMGWSEDKVRKYKKQLISLGLVENFKRLSADKKILGWYIKVNFVWFKDVNEETPKKPPSGKTPPLGDLDPNALNTDSLNALSTSINIAEAETSAKDQTNQIFDLFYEFNPMTDYGNLTQRKAINQLIDKIGFDKLKGSVLYALGIQKEQFAPRISTPLQLKNKFGDVIAYSQSQKANKPKRLVL